MKILIFGATSAIARATAHLFAARNDELFLIARNAERLKSLTQDLNIRYQKNYQYLAIDLDTINTHAEIIAKGSAALNGIDAALIAHGTLPDQKICENSVPATLATFTTNCLSVISLATLLGNELAVQKHGCIAVISSVAGDRGRQSNYIYGAAKGAVSLFLQGLRNRLSKENVNVLTIKPGFVDTPMTQSFKKGLLWAQPETIAKLIVKSIDKKYDVIYTPKYWGYIMQIIQFIPEKIFKRMSL